MKSRQNRDEIVLAIKYTAPFPYEQREKIQVDFGGNGTKSLRLSLEASLKKLGTTYIDIFYVHWWDFTVSIPEFMRTLDDLAAAGKILHLGISDTPAWVVSKANEYARCHGLRQFVVYQGLWNAGTRDFERDILPMCCAEGMAVVLYGTLGQGRFQTKAAFQEREKTNPGRTGPPINEHDKAISSALEEVANARSTDIASVALAYIRSKAPYIFPLIGGRKVEHLRGNIAALELTLSEDDAKEIEKAYYFDHGFPHTFLSGSRFGQGTPRGAFGPRDVFLSDQMGHLDWVQAERSLDSYYS
ncbi:Aldo/keto reductase [Penicillium odoratum]|uniref:Aldo/keto reductase n=1 Tax=Penicillium odoratum TaxID=1167516 RepID=UPI0025465E23|nr:Aldo/keto reductase [Penicillium odoratum]KAJ5769061.1 Aldo/keto reductase [Penicillium odoratum]